MNLRALFEQIKGEKRNIAPGWKSKHLYYWAKRESFKRLEKYTC